MSNDVMGELTGSYCGGGFKHDITVLFIRFRMRPHGIAGYKCDMSRLTFPMAEQ